MIVNVETASYQWHSQFPRYMFWFKAKECCSVQGIALSTKQVQSLKHIDHQTTCLVHVYIRYEQKSLPQDNYQYILIIHGIKITLVSEYNKSNIQYNAIYLFICWCNICIGLWNIVYKPDYKNTFNHHHSVTHIHHFRYLLSSQWMVNYYFCKQVYLKIKCI